MLVLLLSLGWHDLFRRQLLIFGFCTSTWNLAWISFADALQSILQLSKTEYLPFSWLIGWIRPSYCVAGTFRHWWIDVSMCSHRNHSRFHARIATTSCLLSSQLTPLELSLNDIWLHEQGERYQPNTPTTRQVRNKKRTKVKQKNKHVGETNTHQLRVCTPQQANH